MARTYPTYASWAQQDVSHGKRAVPPIPAREAREERREAAYWAARDVVTV